jgi:hypothetical protein
MLEYVRNVLCPFYILVRTAVWSSADDLDVFGEFWVIGDGPQFLRLAFLDAAIDSGVRNLFVTLARAEDLLKEILSGLCPQEYCMYSSQSALN